MKLLANGKDTIEEFLITGEKAFEKIIEQLKERKETLEKRLIENDTDPAQERAKLRGELEGLHYAIIAIQKFA